MIQKKNFRKSKNLFSLSPEQNMNYSHITPLERENIKCLDVSMRCDQFPEMSMTTLENQQIHRINPV